MPSADRTWNRHFMPLQHASVRRQAGMGNATVLPPGPRTISCSS